MISNLNEMLPQSGSTEIDYIDSHRCRFLTWTPSFNHEIMTYTWNKKLWMVRASLEGNWPVYMGVHLFVLIHERTGCLKQQYSIQEGEARHKTSHCQDSLKADPSFASHDYASRRLCGSTSSDLILWLEAGKSSSRVISQWSTSTGMHQSNHMLG